MDFVERLPKVNDKSVIFVVVDRLTKDAHFLALKHPFTTIQIAKKLHGLPRSIVRDRDPIFVSRSWQILFHLQGTSFNLSSAYHPQTDGHTEAMNKSVEMYLRCLCMDNPKKMDELVN